MMFEENALSPFSMSPDGLVGIGKKGITINDLSDVRRGFNLSPIQGLVGITARSLMKYPGT